jgi:hypothetical protein
MKFLRCFAIFLFLAATRQAASAHQVETVEFEFQKLENQWRLSGEMDIAYMLPETRKLPGAQPLSREATMKAPPEELARIRRETENTLRNLLRITFAGKDIPWKIEFPDFEKKPFSLPEEAADWALLSTRIIIDAQPGPGELQIHWSGEEESELIVLTEDSEDGEIVSVEPGGVITLVKMEGQSMQVVPVKQAAIRGWIENGFFHVVPVGFDHILFILGMFLMVPQWKPLLKQSLMFTLAHSFTLALSALGWVNVPARPLQILIAFSIAFVGVENLLSKKVGRLRLFVVLAFGLVHGIGYASGLGDTLRNMTRGQLTGPLLGFNLGVELAQITVLAAAFLFFLPLRKWDQKARTAGSVFVALAGAAWMIERLVA